MIKKKFLFFVLFVFLFNVIFTAEIEIEKKKYDLIGLDYENQCLEYNSQIEIVNFGDNSNFDDIEIYKKEKLKIEEKYSDKKERKDEKLKELELEYSHIYRLKNIEILVYEKYDETKIKKFKTNEYGIFILNVDIPNNYIIEIPTSKNYVRFKRDLTINKCFYDFNKNRNDEIENIDENITINKTENNLLNFTNINLNGITLNFTNVKDNSNLNIVDTFNYINNFTNKEIISSFEIQKGEFDKDFVNLEIKNIDNFSNLSFGKLNEIKIEKINFTLMNDTLYLENLKVEEIYLIYKELEIKEEKSNFYYISIYITILIIILIFSFVSFEIIHLKHLKKQKIEDKKLQKKHEEYEIKKDINYVKIKKYISDNQYDFSRDEIYKYLKSKEFDLEVLDLAFYEVYEDENEKKF